MSRLLLVVLIAILMAVTNPGMQDFEVYMQAQLASQARQQGAGWLVDAASAVKAITGFDGVKAYTTLLLADAQRTDVIIGSVYTVTIGGRRYTWVGVFRQFVPLGG